MEKIKEFKGSSPNTIKEMNMSIVIDKIRCSTGITRAELSRNLDLTQTSISRIVNELLRKHIILECGIGKSEGGKKPIILKYNSKREFVLAGDFNIDYFNLAISDLNGEIIFEKKYNIFKSPETIDLRIDISKNILSFIKESKINKNKIKIMVLGIPATIDPYTQITSSFLYKKSWDGINISNEINKIIEIPIFVQNEANLAALGEYKFRNKIINNFVFISIGIGIGAGIILNGRIFKGYSGSAGEIGFLIIDKINNQKRDINLGQFENLASIYSTCKKANDLIEKGKAKSLLKYCSHENKLSIEDIITSKKNKNEISTRIINEALNNLAYGISNVIVTLNPELLVISGEIFELDNSLIYNLKEIIEKIIPVKTHIELSQLGEKAELRGAIYSALNEYDKNLISPIFH